MKTSLRHTLGLGLLLLAGAAQAANVSIDLYAKSGSTALPGGASVAVLGYTTGATAATDLVAAPGGPALIVNQGDVVTVNLTNTLGEATALLFQGQAMAPDTTGAAAGGGTKSYTFIASSPGTFLYEAGPLANAQHQAAMGLHGALIVRPATALQAYDSPATPYDDEAVLVLSELDPALHAAPATFDLRNYAPRYFLINGQAYPLTAPIPTAAGRKVLLRYLNAGIRHHSMTVLGLEQAVVARDGNPLPYPARRAAETIAPGQTMDAIVTVPAGATGQFALYDGSLSLFNGQAAGFGGMLTFLAAGGTPPAGGPVVTSLSLSASLATLTAGIAAGAGRAVTAAEYWIDGGPHAAMTGTFGGPSTTVAATLPAQPTGSHTVYARGQDDLGTWGPARSTTFAVDTAGPITTGLVLAPDPSNGSANVALSATGDDRASGNANVTAAEYWIDGGAHTAMTVNAAAPVASLTAIIAGGTVNALTPGARVVSVRSQDALGNWGAPATANLVVDKTGPVASAVAASPNPLNGTVGFNSSTAAVRVTATLTDALSAVAAAEGFIDTVGASGSGFPFIPSDGVFNGLTEAGYADVPLATISRLASGTHTILVHGKDAAGNWGATATVTLVLDRTGPIISSATLTPSTLVVGAPSTLLTVVATDAGGSGLAGGQYWVDGSATPPAGPTAFTGNTATLATGTLPGGVHTVYVRMRDAAGNWSAVASVTLAAMRAVDDAKAISANTSASQTSDSTSAQNLLSNDLPAGLAGRTTRIASAPGRTAGAGAGTITVSCPGSLGTAASPAIGGSTVCTNGAYRVTLTGVGANGNARQSSKRGTYQFTYTEVLNGVTSTATVTITVN